MLYGGAVFVQTAEQVNQILDGIEEDMHVPSSKPPASSSSDLSTMLNVGPTANSSKPVHSE
jgi:hypothetical protein